MPTLTTDQLQILARYGAQARLEELETEMAAIQALLAGGARRGRRPGRPAGQVSKRPAGRGRGKLSAAGRAAIAAAQKARWAKIKSTKSGDTTDRPVPKKAAGGRKRAGATRKGRRSGMSAANRKAQSDRMKNYWAARRATKK